MASPTVESPGGPAADDRRDRDRAVGDLTDKVVLVTGAAGGIGRAVCRLAAGHDATVVLADLRESDVAAAAEELGAEYVHVDVTVRDEVRAAVNRVQADFGRVDGVVNAAGANTRTAFLALTDEEWDSIVSVNLRGAFLVTQEAARTMVDHGGAIVHIASVGAWQPYPGLVHYESAKAGVLGLTRGAAAALSSYGIRVNAVAPGVVRTPLTQATLDDPAAARQRLAKIPLQRIGAPADVAATVVFLLSDAASWTTGSTYTVDGGQTMT